MRWHDWPLRTAYLPCSAITMTSVTCPRRYQSAGFTVLRDARTQISIRNEPVDIAGLRYWTHRMADITRVVRGASPTLLLIAHTPTRLIEAMALSVPLMLCGHTHGGQIVLPGIGAVAAREFPVVAGAGTAREHDGVRDPRRGYGVRSGARQLPAGSGHPSHPAARWLIQPRGPLRR